MSLTDDPADFEVTTSIEEGCAVLALHGRVENLAAFDLAAALDATIDLPLEAVVLDLAELEFIGAAGVVAVANVEKRLAEVGIELAVRTPSTLVERLLGMMPSAETADLERAEPGHSSLEREQVGEPLFPSRPYPSNAVAQGSEKGDGHSYRSRCGGRSTAPCGGARTDLGERCRRGQRFAASPRGAHDRGCE